LRRLFQETEWCWKDLIIPLFIIEGENRAEEIPAMPGIYRYTIDRVIRELAHPVYHEAVGILLFGIPNPEEKDECGSAAFAETGVIQRACRAIKTEYPELNLITDLCLCEYTSHGHCGLINADGAVDNDRTLEILNKVALSHAEAGADMIAPSDMMDGRVAAIRKALDAHDFSDRLLLAYSAKFASAFYGPFREAAGSAPSFGDRKSYQMPPGNRREAIREIEEDVMEGADLIMVKPALSYLDIIREARDRFLQPLVAYNVSGEYSMVKAAAQAGWIDERRAVDEILLSIKRAGADRIITYHAKDLYEWEKGRGRQ
jgi:porphobilinogen synthase